MPRELARFLAVGAANTALSIAVYLALGGGAVAAGAGFAAGAANGYVWNRRWTFGRPGSIVRYAVVQAGGLIATSALVSLLAGADLTRGGAYALTLCTVTGSTFLANRRWTFRSTRLS